MKNNQPIKTVVFDLGGVLIDWNPAYLYRKIFDDKAKMDYFFKEICTPHWNEQQDAGRPLATATQILVDQFPEYKLEIQAYYGRWTEMLGGPIFETVNILKQIHQQQQHRLYALTNWSHETFPVALERYDFLQLFEGILVSGTEKLKKPDPAIYQLLLKRYQIEPHSALFIDDNKGNVAAAKAEGIQAIHFQSPTQLKNYLIEKKILQL